MTVLIGILGNALLALCALPQAIKSIRTGSAEDLSWGFLLMWGLGEIGAAVYAFAELNKDSLLLANYALNMVCIAVILGVKLNAKGEIK